MVLTCIQKLLVLGTHICLGLGLCTHNYFGGMVAQLVSRMPYDILVINIPKVASSRPVRMVLIET